ncbi:multidrug effflux MFS transporter [Chachezhania sediminis]|uniref:multidrug effflux MFS transporter n=1 Tax=Chachezhania sediminis TaxID=2599291 RepID=UPI00131D4C4D|nr:multidrug effflux MFS transporter [Chachezhania sediminis]
MPKSVPSRFLDRTSPPHMVTLIFLSALAPIAMNIFLPSLPQMALYFDTDYHVMQLSVALYLGVNALLQAIIGPFSDKYGRRPVILFGVVVFCFATLGCIFAPSAGVFLAFRMLQAIATVGMVLSRAAVRDMYSADEAASVIGYVTMGFAIAPMVSPVVGGALGELLGWQANFWLLIVFGILCFFLTRADFGETARVSGKSLGQQFREYPELLTSPRFWGYTMAAALSSGAFFAYLGGAPYVGATHFGLSPAVLGLAMGAPAVGYFFGNFFTGKFSTRFGINRMIISGCIINAFAMLALLALFYAGFGSHYTFFGMIVIVGFGNGMAMPNAMSGSLSVRPHLAGTAAGLSGAIMLGGGAGLSVLAGALLTEASGPYPIIWMMLITSVMGYLCMLVVIRRERQLGL